MKLLANEVRKLTGGGDLMSTLGEAIQNTTLADSTMLDFLWGSNLKSINNRLSMYRLH